jgi:hypothetical protein
MTHNAHVAIAHLCSSFILMVPVPLDLSTEGQVENIIPFFLIDIRVRIIIVAEKIQ